MKFRPGPKVNPEPQCAEGVNFDCTLDPGHEGPCDDGSPIIDKMDPRYMFKHRHDAVIGKVDVQTISNKPITSLPLAAANKISITNLPAGISIRGNDGGYDAVATEKVVDEKIAAAMTTIMQGNNPVVDPHEAARLREREMEMQIRDRRHKREQWSWRLAASALAIVVLVIATLIYRHHSKPDTQSVIDQEREAACVGGLYLPGKMMSSGQGLCVISPKGSAK